jgi:hypothetical protein
VTSVSGFCFVLSAAVLLVRCRLSACGGLGRVGVLWVGSCQPGVELPGPVLRVGSLFSRLGFCRLVCVFFPVLLLSLSWFPFLVLFLVAGVSRSVRSVPLKKKNVGR